MEVRHFLNLAQELKYLSGKEFEKITQDCNILGVKLNNLIKSLNRNDESR